MSKIKQVSFFEYPQLIGTAIFGIRLTPQQVNDRLGLYGLERSFDDFDFFGFLGVKKGDEVFGFRQYLHPNAVNYSYVSVENADDPVTAIRNLLGEPQLEVTEFDDAS